MIYKPNSATKCARYRIIIIIQYTRLETSVSDGVYVCGSNCNGYFWYFKVIILHCFENMDAEEYSFDLFFYIFLSIKCVRTVTIAI